MNVGTAQALNHAGGDLRGWAERFAPRLLWWEAAAAGISSVHILAMLASPPDTHRQIAKAYVEIGALSSILDGLVDLPTDDPLNHNWSSHYECAMETADRVVALADDAQRALRGIPNELMHRAILAGMLAHNLVICDVRLDHVREPCARLVQVVPYVRTGMRLFELRSWLQRAHRR